MNEFKNILIENAKEYFGNALSAEKRYEFNSSVTLYFKAISALCDLYLFEKEGRMITNHSERFRILKLKYPLLYGIMDKDFPFYQDSYKLRLNMEVSEILKEDAKRLFKLLNINI